MSPSVASIAGPPSSPYVQASICAPEASSTVVRAASRVSATSAGRVESSRSIVTDVTGVAPTMPCVAPPSWPCPASSGPGEAAATSDSVTAVTTTAAAAATTVVSGRRARRFDSERAAIAVAPTTPTTTAAVVQAESGAPSTNGTKTLAAAANAPAQAAMRVDVDARPPARRSRAAETPNHTRAASESGADATTRSAANHQSLLQSATTATWVPIVATTAPADSPHQTARRTGAVDVATAPQHTALPSPRARAMSWSAVALTARSWQWRQCVLRRWPQPAWTATPSPTHVGR